MIDRLRGYRYNSRLIFSSHSAEGIMHAVIKTGGKQYRVYKDEVLRVELLDAEEGSSVTFDDVLLVSDGETVKVGQPHIEGAKVVASVLGHGRADKVTIIKMRRRKNYRRKQGHRQHFTELKISEITL